MPTETKKTSKINLQTILSIACAVLLLAVIVLAAFGYTWRRDLLAANKKNATLQMEISAFDSLTTELTNLRMEKASLESELDNTARELANLKASLESTPEPDVTPSTEPTDSAETVAPTEE